MRNKNQFYFLGFHHGYENIFRPWKFRWPLIFSRSFEAGYEN